MFDRVLLTSTKERDNVSSLPAPIKYLMSMILLSIQRAENRKCFYS
jgi:hypothetical protein